MVTWRFYNHNPESLTYRILTLQETQKNDSQCMKQVYNDLCEERINSADIQDRVISRMKVSGLRDNTEKQPLKPIEHLWENGREGVWRPFGKQYREQDVNVKTRGGRLFCVFHS